MSSPCSSPSDTCPPSTVSHEHQLELLSTSGDPSLVLCDRGSYGLENRLPLSTCKSASWPHKPLSLAGSFPTSSKTLNNFSSCRLLVFTHRLSISLSVVSDL
ncbi:hypothetical protein ILYODFUR_037187 [Ilyodon furcidens]|uniref:Uncharacterized protein n=1 Tax=Ilyodon furcidens TaxID=33524 RepID=A0ABV0VMP1_9TELE